MILARLLALRLNILAPGPGPHYRFLPQMGRIGINGSKLNHDIPRFEMDGKLCLIFCSFQILGTLAEPEPF